MYIAIAGNIGSGKSSLTRLLSERIGGRAYFEESDNPYIGDFYNDMNRWSFNLQIFFLGERIAHTQQQLAHGGDLIQDRTVYEDACIFAANLHESGLMASRDYQTYRRIFDLATALIPQPDLLIYLKASVPTLIHQIRKRGRAYEMNIDEGYLARLNTKYDQWIGSEYHGKVEVVEVDRVNFIDDPSQLDKMVERIEMIRKSASK